MFQKQFIFRRLPVFLAITMIFMGVNQGYTQVSDVLTDIMNSQFKHYEVVNQENINTADLEFSPAIYDSSVVFLANGRRISGMSRAEAKKYFKLFVSAINEDGSLTSEQPIQAFRSDYNEGPLCFSHDGQEVYFTKNIKIDEPNGSTRLNLSIFYSQKVNDHWTEPIELLKAAGDVSFCHPAVSSDGQKLYFSSNMGGGYGKYDIYYIRKVDGNWSDPVNLGPEVNTDGNELFSTLLSDNLLAYSANIVGGLGGYDIYVAQMAGGNVLNRIHLDQPVNSEADDIGLVVAPGNRYAYFSSSRSGGRGQDDIYLLKSLPAERPVETNQLVVVIDSARLQRLQGINCIVKTIDGQQVSNGETNKNGEWITPLMSGKSYLLKVTSTKHLPFSTPFICGAKVQVKLVPLPCITLSGVTLDQETNQHLTGAEIRWVNNCGEREVSTLADSSGYFNLCLPQGCSGILIGTKKGYSMVRIQVNALVDDLTLNVNFSKQMLSIVKEPIKKNSKLILENIYFDFNESTIRPATDRELKELVVLMNQYPEMRIRIIAHTDSRGEAKFNLTLSLKRALEIKKYLIAKGIDESRMETEGRGESQLRNRCKDGVNCTEEEHQYNRRVEIQILEK